MEIKCPICKSFIFSLDNNYCCNRCNFSFNKDEMESKEYLLKIKEYDKKYRFAKYCGQEELLEELSEIRYSLVSNCVCNVLSKEILRIENLSGIWKLIHTKSDFQNKTEFIGEYEFESDEIKFIIYNLFYIFDIRRWSGEMFTDNSNSYDHGQSINLKIVYKNGFEFSYDFGFCSVAQNIFERLLNDYLNMPKSNYSKTETKEIVISFDDKIYDMNIEELNLTIRTYNCLKRAEINTVDDLTKKSKSDIQKIRNLGNSGFNEIVVALKNLDLYLKE